MIKRVVTDYHSHILPGIDDGSKSPDESIKMINTLVSQGIENIVATPHFYAHREESVLDFLGKRKNAMNALVSFSDALPEIFLGAEVALEIGISKCPDINKLSIEGTNLILLEPSFYAYIDGAPREVEEIAYGYSLMPIIAHIDRYIDIYSRSEMEEFLKMDVIFQVNNTAFADRKSKKFVLNLFKEGYPIVFGSDCHNMLNRPPNFNLLEKIYKKYPRIILTPNTLLNKFKV